MVVDNAGLYLYYNDKWFWQLCFLNTGGHWDGLAGVGEDEVLDGDDELQEQDVLPGTVVWRV